MVVARSHAVPVAVGRAIAVRDARLAALHGLGDSGLVLTERHLFAWRAGGTSPALALAAIDRILVDTGGGSDHADLMVLGRTAGDLPLILSVPRHDLIRTLAFLEQVVRTAERWPTSERLGPVLRFSFPPSAPTPDRAEPLEAESAQF